MAWPWRGVFGVPAPGVFPWVVLFFLCCAFGRLSIFDLEAGARTGLNTNDPAWAAGISNLAEALMPFFLNRGRGIKASLEVWLGFSLEPQGTKFHLVSG